MSLISLIFFSTVVTLCYSREFQFLNNYGQEIWVGIQGNAGKPPLLGGGLILPPGQRINGVFSADDWAGRFWGRTGCNGNTCETGDCGNGLNCAGNGGAPPVSLAEITLNGYGGIDYYDISLVDGFNVKIAMEPLGAQGDGSQYSCKKAGCQQDVNAQCPEKLKVYGSGGVVGCKSACTAFNTDQYCCRNQYGQPETCNPDEWPADVNSAKYFKQMCPDAYSYAYDDKKSTFTCKAPAYLITFG